MELRQIRSFLSVAETLHFGRSSSALHLSQPALSLQIKALEEELGVRLFDRNRQRTVLTEAGAIFRLEAGDALHRLESAARKAQWAAAGKLGLVRVGFISTAGHEMVPTLMQHFRRLYPEVEFSLRNILTSDQIPMLRDGALDVGFLRLPVGEAGDVTITPVHSEPLVLLVPANHRLASQKKVRLRDLKDEWFVLYERRYAPGFHDLIAGILSRANVVPKVAQTAGEMSTILSLVASGMGVAVLPASAARQHNSNVVVCSITDNIPLSQIGMAVSNRESLPVVQRFVDLAKQMLVPSYSVPQKGKETR